MRLKGKNKSQRKNKWCTVQLLTTCCPMPDSVPALQSAPFQVTPPIYILGTMFSGVVYAFGQFRSPVPGVLSPAFLCTSSMAEHDTQKCP